MGAWVSPAGGPPPDHQSGALSPPPRMGRVQGPGLPFGHGAQGGTARLGSRITPVELRLPVRRLLLP